MTNKWQRQNPEKIRERRARDSKYRDYMREYMREYRKTENGKKKMKAAQQAWHSKPENKEHKRLYYIEYYKRKRLEKEKNNEQ